MIRKPYILIYQVLTDVLEIDNVESLRTKVFYTCNGQEYKFV